MLNCLRGLSPKVVVKGNCMGEELGLPFACWFARSWNRSCSFSSAFCMTINLNHLWIAKALFTVPIDHIPTAKMSCPSISSWNKERVKEVGMFLPLLWYEASSCSDQLCDIATLGQELGMVRRMMRSFIMELWFLQISIDFAVLCQA